MSVKSVYINKNKYFTNNYTNVFFGQDTEQQGNAILSKIILPDTSTKIYDLKNYKENYKFENGYIKDNDGNISNSTIGPLNYSQLHKLFWRLKGIDYTGNFNFESSFTLDDDTVQILNGSANLNINTNNFLSNQNFNNQILGMFPYFFVSMNNEEFLDNIQVYDRFGIEIIYNAGSYTLENRLYNFDPYNFLNNRISTDFAVFANSSTTTNSTDFFSFAIDGLSSSIQRRGENANSNLETYGIIFDLIEIIIDTENEVFYVVANFFIRAASWDTQGGTSSLNMMASNPLFQPIEDYSETSFNLGDNFFIKVLELTKTTYTSEFYEGSASFTHSFNFNLAFFQDNEFQYNYKYPYDPNSF